MLTDRCLDTIKSLRRPGALLSIAAPSRWSFCRGYNPHPCIQPKCVSVPEVAIEKQLTHFRTKSRILYYRIPSKPSQPTRHLYFLSTLCPVPALSVFPNCIRGSRGSRVLEVECSPRGIELNNRFMSLGVYPIGIAPEHVTKTIKKPWVQHRIHEVGDGSFCQDIGRRRR